MRRYLCATGTKAHRTRGTYTDAEVDRLKGIWRTEHVFSLCGWYVSLKRNATKDAPLCKVCERIAAKLEAKA